MRRYKAVVCIFLILSVSNFVLAAPVAAQRVREARNVDEGDNLIGLGKRILEKDPLESSDWFWNVWAPSQHQGSSSTPNDASGIHPNPSFPSSESKPPQLSTSGGNELSLDPEGGTKLTQPETSSGIRSAFKSSSKAKSVSWGPSKEVKLSSGAILTVPLQSGINNKLPPPPGREGYLAKMAAQQSPPNGFFSDSMNVIGKLGKLKLLPKFRRFSSTFSSAVDPVQRELQSTV